jgi:RNA polymerase sigma factor (sigma-70 family)
MMATLWPVAPPALDVLLCLNPPASTVRRGPVLQRIRGMGRSHALEKAPTRMARIRESHTWTDEEVLRACREGQARAWREIVHRYTRLVHGIARAMGLQSDDADEVFQLTFTTLFRSLARLRQPDRIEAWLVTASRRATLRLLRERRRHLRLAERHAASAPEASAPPADERIETVRERERAARALRSLAEPCRTLLTALFADHRIPYRELASRLGLAVGSLGAQRARCLQRLRRRLVIEMASERDGRVGAPAGARRGS